VRKAALASILRQARHGIRPNEHLQHPSGVEVFEHACRMGLEGIVSKRLGSRYRSGRSPDWLKFKNPAAPAVKREPGRAVRRNYTACYAFHVRCCERRLIDGAVANPGR
jgi:ATP-dependent DNA ligase